MAQAGEPARVLRRTRSGAALLSMSAEERAALLDSLGFLEGVVRLSGQSHRHGLCANHRTTAGDHPESCGDVQHEHRKQAQRSYQPMLRKLRGYQPSVRVFVSCHGRDYTPAPGPVGSEGRYPSFFWARSL